MVGFLKKKWIRYGVVIIVVGAAVGYFLLQPEEETEYVVATVEKGSITQIVTATGSIKADPTIDLHFQKNGKVSDILVEEGESVEKGEVLAMLENEALGLEVRRNKANVDYASAQYNQLKAGSTSEEIRIAESDVQSAEAALDAAQSELESTRAVNEANIELAQLAYDQAEDTMKAAERDLETTKKIAENELSLLDLEGDNTQKVELESAYLNATTSLDTVMTTVQEVLFTVEEMIDELGEGFLDVPLNTLKTQYFNPSKEKYNATIELQQGLSSGATNEEKDKAITAALETGNSALLLLSQAGETLRDNSYKSSEQESYILEISTLSSRLSSAVLSLSELQSSITNIKTGSTQDTETVKLNYQLQIDAAQSMYDTAINSFEKATFDLEQSKINAANSNKNAEAQLDIKEAALEAAKANLALKRSPVRETDLAPLLAQISLAKIALEIAQNDQSESQLTAPINGIVTFIHGQVGENISLSETALSAFLTLQAQELMVEANIPETDVSKMKVGDKVEMTIDAFDFTEKFAGTVSYIDRAETIIQGVVYYQIKTSFDLEDDRLKSGMTTNLEITTNQKDDVLVIPARAINYEDSTRYVEVLRNGSPEKVIITTGLESDQEVEVVSGLEEGDQIITFVR